MVHVQSPCTTYNNTYQILKGTPGRASRRSCGTCPTTMTLRTTTMPIPPSAPAASPWAYSTKNTERPNLTKTVEDTLAKVKPMTMQQMVDFYEIK